MKPKVKDLGFTDEELLIVCENIANGLASNENVTDDDINARIDSTIPALKLAQSASNRSFERMKKQFEEDHKKSEEQKKAEEEAAKKKAEEEAAKNAMPDWFKKYKEENDKVIAELRGENATMKKEKANESFVSKAKKALEKVDPNYYNLLLKGKVFESEDDVNSFVGEVTEGWNTLVKARNIQELGNITPPGGQKTEPKEASDLVKARIEARQKAEASANNSVVKGLPTSN